MTNCAQYATVSGIKRRIGSFSFARCFVDGPIREPGLRAQLQRPYRRVTGARVAKASAPSQVSRISLAGRATADAPGAYRRSPGGCFESGLAAAEGRDAPSRPTDPLSFRCASPPVQEQSTYHAHAGFRVRGQPAFHVKRRGAYALARGTGWLASTTGTSAVNVSSVADAVTSNRNLRPHGRQAARNCLECETVSAIRCLINSFSSDV